MLQGTKGACSSDGSALRSYAERRKFDPHAARLFCLLRPISHMFDFHAHAREGVSLRVSPFLSNFIADARYNTYVRFRLSTVIGFSSGDRESREIGTHGVKIETRTLRDTRRATCRKRLGNTWDRQKPGSWDLEFKQAWGNPSFLRPN